MIRAIYENGKASVYVEEKGDYYENNKRRSERVFKLIPAA